MKAFLLILILGALLLLSCKHEDSVDIKFTGKPIDEELPGLWVRNYSSRDMNNGITVWTDSIYFSETNSGYQRTYQFTGLKENNQFEYYSEKDTLSILIHQKVEKWVYSIRNDSLFMSSSLPLYSIYYAIRIYKKTN